MAIDKDNRALKRFIGWLRESDLEVIVWSTEDDVPLLVSLVDITQAPPHATTVRVIDTNEGDTTKGGEGVPPPDPNPGGQALSVAPVVAATAASPARGASVDAR